MKTLTIILLLLITQTTSSSHQTAKKNFNFTSTTKGLYVRFTYFNHASRIMEGTWTHEIKDGIYYVKNTQMFANESKVLYEKEINVNIADRIQEIGLDNLEDFYHNSCIMITSGNKYFVTLKNINYEHTTYMHNFYLPEIDKLVSIMNELAPEKHRIWYESPENKQDCN